tara:strand:- start:48 stop:500 length:453 start_codon:yes stop_codon:yes gene_type:complete
MNRTIKLLAALLIIGMSFTACTKEEVQPSPISFSYPPSYQMSLNDVLDSASGSYGHVRYHIHPTTGDTFTKYLHIDLEATESMTMILTNPEDGRTNGELVNIVVEDFGFISNIQEGGITTVVIYELEYDRLTILPSYPSTRGQRVYSKLR